MPGWTPSSIRKLIALLAGVTFFATGIVLMIKGIAAQGTLDIQSALLSGNVQTGSAGLIIAFLSTFIMIFSLAGTEPSYSISGHTETSAANNPRQRAFYISTLSFRLFWILIATILAVGVAAWGMAAIAPVSPFHQFLEVAIGVIGIADVILFAALLVSLFTHYH